MNKRKLALFLFSNDQEAAYLANALIEKGWNIKAFLENMEILEKQGVKREHLTPFYWGASESFITPSDRTILSLRSRAKDRAYMEKKGIPRVDLVCVDFYAVKDHSQGSRWLFRSMKMESAKIFLLMAAIEGGRIPVCHPHERKDVADWIASGMPNKKNYLLRFTSSALLGIAQELLALGSYCDRLRQ